MRGYGYGPPCHGTWHGHYFSAYGIAVKHGYKGTELQWLESLKGAPGEKGERGDGVNVLGLYPTLAALIAAVPSPVPGAAYCVGTAQDNEVYLWDGMQWRNIGSLQGPPGEPGKDGVITVATPDTLGGVKIGANLTISPDGVLSVDTADVVEQDNTKPITSAAVHTEVGNIEVLLSAL